MAASPIINSINFEDGEKAADRAGLFLAKKFGAAVIALTIDEDRHVPRPPEEQAGGGPAPGGIRLRQARPAAKSDLLIDPLTFTIATGNEDDRKLGQWTLEGIKADPRRLSRISRSSWACRTSRSA